MREINDREFHPVVSIIVPVYNVEEKIRKCICSILDQSYKNFELIIVNDGTPDESIERIRDLINSDKRIILIEKKNGGLASARNAGLKVAKGNYICFIDSDDFVDINHLENMLNVFTDKNASVFNEIFFQNEDKEYKSNFRKKSKINEVDINQALEYVARDDGFAGYAWNKLFINSILKKENILFDEKILFVEDFLFSIEYIIACEKNGLNTIKILNAPTYHYVLNESSLTQVYNNGSITWINSMNMSWSLLKNRGKILNDIMNINYLSAVIRVIYHLPSEDVKNFIDSKLIFELKKNKFKNSYDILNSYLPPIRKLKLFILNFLVILKKIEK